MQIQKIDFSQDTETGVMNRKLFYKIIYGLTHWTDIHPIY